MSSRCRPYENIGRNADIPRLYKPIDLTTDSLFTDYPEQFPDNPGCGTNLSVKTLPGGSKQAWNAGRSFDGSGTSVPWPRRRELAGPASIARNIYGVYRQRTPDGTPVVGSRPSYDYTYRYIPEDTMYARQHELRQFDEGGKLISGGFQAYPFHHRYVREVENYAKNSDGSVTILPYPTMFRWGKPAEPVGTGKWGAWGQVAN